MSKIIEKWHKTGEGRVIIQRTQDVTQHVKEAQALREKHGGREDPDAYHVARVPLVVLEAFLKRRGVSLADFTKDPTLVKELVNSPEMKIFRVWQGRM